MLSNSNYNKPLWLMNTLRMLWEQHVMWTRSFIISTAADLGDLKPVTQRLLRNPVDMANVLRTFYGNQIADTFQTLFTEHLMIAADLVNAAKAGDSVKAAESEKKWYQNADEIAAFLSSINMFWNRQKWQDFLYDHLAMTKNEALYRLSGQYEKDIEIYDQIEKEALQMADYMSKGIVQQFRL